MCISRHFCCTNNSNSAAVRGRAACCMALIGTNRIDAYLEQHQGSSMQDRIIHQTLLLESFQQQNSTLHFHYQEFLMGFTLKSVRAMPNKFISGGHADTFGPVGWCEFVFRNFPLKITVCLQPHMKGHFKVSSCQVESWLVIWVTYFWSK